MAGDTDAIVDFIWQQEAGGRTDIWEIGAPSSWPDPRTLTVDTILSMQDEEFARTGNVWAAGAVQIQADTLRMLRATGQIDGSALFTDEVQRQATVALMNRRGLSEWSSGAISTAEFGTRLAQEWASLPVLQDTYRDGRPIRRGQGFYGGVSTNPTAVRGSVVDGFEAVLGEAPPPPAPDPSVAESGWSERSAALLGGTDPVLVDILTEARRRSGIDIQIMGGLRTPEEQAEHLAAGRSQTSNSYHLHGNALDVMIIGPDGQPDLDDYADYEPFARIVQEVGRERGIEVTWGGDWESLRDGPHFQIGDSFDRPHAATGEIPNQLALLQSGGIPHSHGVGAPPSPDPGGAPGTPPIPADTSGAPTPSGPSPAEANPGIVPTGVDQGFDDALANPPRPLTGMAEGLSPSGDNPFRADGATFGDMRIPYAQQAVGGPGPVRHAGWGQAFGDEWQDSYIVRRTRQAWQGWGETVEPGFDGFTAALGAGQYSRLDYLSGARSTREFERLQREIEFEGIREQRRQSYTGGWSAPLMGGMLSPDSLVLAAAGGVGGLVARGAGRAALGALRGSTGLARGAGAVAQLGASGAINLGASTALEIGRAGTDPNATSLDSFFRIGADAMLNAVLGGTVGALAGARPRAGLAQALREDLQFATGRFRRERVDAGSGEADVVYGPAGPVDAMRRAAGRAARRGRDAARGAGLAARKVAWEIDRAAEVGRGLKRMGGVFWDRATGRMRVDESILRQRWDAGERRGGAETFEEFVEHEVAAAAARQKGTKGFFRDLWGNEEGAIDFGWGRSGDAHDFGGGGAGLGAAIRAGKRIRFTPGRGRFGDLEVDGRAFRRPGEARRFAQAIERHARAATDEADFRARVQQEIDQLEARAAEAVENLPAVRAAGDDAGAKAVKDHREAVNKAYEKRWQEWLSRLADGPYKRLHRNSLDERVRNLTDLLARDGALRHSADMWGDGVGPSVYSRARTWDGVVMKVLNREAELFARMKGIAADTEIVPGVNRSAFKRTAADGRPAMKMSEFRDRVSKALITGQDDTVEEVNLMRDQLKAAFAEFEAVGEPLGVISRKQTLTQQRAHLQMRLKQMGDPVVEGPVDPAREALEKQIEDLDYRIEHAQFEPGPDYFTRIYRRDAIQQNREAFKERVLKPWMRQQPWMGLYEYSKDEFQQVIDMLVARGADPRRVSRLLQRQQGAPDKAGWKWVRASTEEGAIDQRADQMIDEILGVSEDDMLLLPRDPSMPVFGRHRAFDAPNHVMLKEGFQGNGIADFVETDYAMVLKTYADRMGPAIEMARSFARPVDGIDAAEGFAEALSRARDAEFGAWQKKHGDGAFKGFTDHWDPMERDLLHLRDRVTNRVISNPERWDNRAATVLKQWSQLALMGGSMLPAVQEVGTLIMRHGVTKVWRAATHRLDSDMATQMKIGRTELELAGGALDGALASTLAGFAETGLEAVGRSRAERWLRAGAGRYFMWNGLAPMTLALKRLDAGIRVQDMTARLDRAFTGALTDDDVAELGRFGITPSMAERMGAEPIFKEADGSWNPATENWGDEELVRAFRSAIRQGNENTILMATAADKPTIVDGTVFIRKGPRVDDYARRLGLQSQGRYWKMQSGLLTLPFTFWNYGFAALNKILIAGLDERGARTASGMAAIFGLGYLVAQVRGGEEWGNLGLEERIARAVDQSGLAGIVPQYLHLGQTATMALTGQNPFPWRHKGQAGEVGFGDLALQVAGAGPQVAAAAAQGIVTGDPYAGSMAIPTQNHLLLKGFWDQFTDSLARAEQPRTDRPARGVDRAAVEAEAMG